MKVEHSRPMKKRWGYDNSVAFPCSGYDGTLRVWSLPNRTHQFLQQTCVFNRGDEDCEELNGNLLSSICWSSTGKYLAGAMDNIVNIWTTGGRGL